MNVGTYCIDRTFLRQFHWKPRFVHHYRGCWIWIWGSFRFSRFQEYPEEEKP